MWNKSSRHVAFVALSLLVKAQLPIGVFAAVSDLHSETPLPDSRIATEEPSKPAPKFLTGEVERRSAALESEQSASNAQSLPATQPVQSSQPSPTALEARTPATDSRAAYLLVLKKLAGNQDLTSDDFRNLGIGVLGMESVRPFFQSKARVVHSFPGLPADLAGVKVGDQWIDADATKDDTTVTDPSQPMWAFSCGIAGQSVDGTVIRNGRSIPIHMTRMNIEDIQDKKLRETYEELVESTGAEQAVKVLNAHTDASSGSPTMTWKSTNLSGY